MDIEKLLEIGLSGWMVPIIGALLGGGVAVCVRWNKQSNIKAGGDVAGGDIVKEKGKIKNDTASSKRVTHSVQKNIEAKGDVAGGDIFKGGK